MKKVLLLLGFWLLLLAQFLCAQERENEVQFMRYDKSTKALESSFIFDKKYIAGETVSLNVMLTWSGQAIVEAYIVFPEDTEITSATNMGEGFASLTKTIVGDTIKWKCSSSNGLAITQSPKMATIEVKLPAGTSGDQELDCAYYGELETVNSQVTLAQLGNSPKLTISMSEWYAGIADLGNAISAGENLYAYNDGAQDLIITSFTNLNIPFSYTGTLPLVIKAQEKAQLPFIFNSNEKGIHENNITIVSNGGSENLILSGAAYDDSFELVDFNDGQVQFPPAGWQVEDYNNTEGWHSYSDKARLNNHPDGGLNSSAFITAAVDLTNSSNLFIGFYISVYNANIAHVDIEYSNDNKVTWKVFDSNITQGISEDKKYYKSLSSINGEQVYFKIKGTCELGYLDIDDIVIPNYYINTLPPNSASYIKPAHADNSVSTATSFQWEKVLNADGYKFYIGTTTNLINFYDLGDTSLYDANLESLETYYWKVVPYNEYGDATNCPVWSFTTEEFIPTKWTNDTKLNTQITFTPGVKYIPKLDINSKGESYITWFSGEYGNLNVRAQILNTDGSEKLRREGVLISKNKQASYISDYNNVIDDDDNLITAFVDIRNGLNEAFIYKMNAAGEMLWGNDGISITNFEGRAYKTEIKKDAQGYIYVMVIAGTGETYNTISYVFVKFDAEGNPVWENDIVLSEEIVSWQVMPNGEIYLSTVVGGELFLNLYDTDMVAKFSAPAKVSNNPQFPPTGPKYIKLQADKNNGMYVVWSAASAYGGIIKWQYVNADETISLEAGGQYMSTNQIRTRGYQQIAYHEKTDKLFVAWNEASPATLNKGMYAQRMNNKGIIDFAPTGKVLIECGDSIAGNDGLQMKGDTILWFFSNYKPGTANNNYLNVMFLDTDFNAFDDMDVIRYNSNLTRKPLDAVDSDNNMAVMVWVEEKDGTPSVMAQNLYYDGTLGYIEVDTIPPFAKKIEPISNSKLLLTFNEALFIDSAIISSNYWFDNSAANVVSSELSEPRKVTLLTEGLVEGNHKLYIKNATDTLLNTGKLDSIEFYFVPDIIFPEIVLAKPVAKNKIVVRFSEPINENDLSNLTNYTIEGLAISSISIISPEQIVLHSDELSNGDYILKINHFSDYMGNEVSDTETPLNYTANAGSEVYFYEDFNQGIPDSFKLFNLDKATPAIADFNAAWITAEFPGGIIAAASTSYYEPADQANDWMVTEEIVIQKSAYLYWDAKVLNPVYADGYQVWVSTTGFNPEDFKIMVFEINEESYELTNRFLNLADYGFGDEPIYVAFRNNSNAKYILTIDNISLYTPKLNDLTITKHAIPASVMGSSKIDINATVKVLGRENLTSFNFNWQFDGGNVFTDNVNDVNISMGQSHAIYHSEEFIVPETEGDYILKIWTSNPNGVIDENLENDTVIINISVQQGYVQRLVTIEHFTNTSCGPCAQTNPILEELLSTGENADKVLHLTYHVWWPSDNDIFFLANTEDVVKRQKYYTVTGVPSVSVDGGDLMGPQNVTQEMINEAYVKPGLVKVDGSADYMTSNQKMHLSVDLTNLTDFTSAQPVVYALIAQTFDMNGTPAENGETYFPGVMRDIVSSNTGDVLSKLDSTAHNNFSYEFDLPDDYIEQDAFIGIIIQDVASKKIYMSAKTVINETYKIEFNITYNGVALEGVNVEINNQKYTTDASGLTSVNYMQNNTYTYTITKDGYEMVEGSVEVENGDKVINVELIPTGINTLNNIAISVYPNPAYNEINIVSNEIIEFVSVVNISGSEVLLKENNSMSLNLNLTSLESGLYYVIVNTKNKKSMHKLVVKSL
ncbi:MAG: T9SS type A sorting domain-containing protein [Salinivirgaceae bacterium]|nr:T9SS type A sorting domain-containing protein [Salinivirgaceae bacterium]